MYVHVHIHHKCHDLDVDDEHHVCVHVHVSSNKRGFVRYVRLSYMYIHSAVSLFVTHVHMRYHENAKQIQKACHVCTYAHVVLIKISLNKLIKKTILNPIIYVYFSDIMKTKTRAYMYIHTYIHRGITHT